MQVTNKSKTIMRQPDLSISKANEEKGIKVFDNYMNGARRQVTRDAASFSTWSQVRRLVTKTKIDPSEKHIFEIVKRMEKDKVHSQVALQLTEMTTTKAQNLQKLTLIKMIPFFLAILGLIVVTALILVTRPLAFSNPIVQRYLIISAIFIPMLIWGLKRRTEAKMDMLATNIFLQAASAYASAKLQGKGQIAAMQNLEEMRRKAKTMEAQKSEKKSEKKLEKKESKKEAK
jgi:uncharacterized membrane protein YqjE